VNALVKRGKDGGEGAWLLSLELLQFEHKREAFDDRSIEYAIAFEQSPPSWEPPPVPEPVAAAGETALAGAKDDGAMHERPDRNAESLKLSGVLVGSSNIQLGNIAEFAQRRSVVPIDMTAVDRIDFVCAGSLMNAIYRVESQRKAVQIVGASPIIRALLLLIGVSPRHFLKRAT